MWHVCWVTKITSIPTCPLVPQLRKRKSFTFIMDYRKIKETQSFHYFSTLNQNESFSYLKHISLLSVRKLSIPDDLEIWINPQYTTHHHTPMRPNSYQGLPTHTYSFQSHILCLAQKYDQPANDWQIFEKILQHERKKPQRKS